MIPPINPTIIPCQGRNTFAPAVIATSPPSIPAANWGISKRYLLLLFHFNAKPSNTADKPPDIAPLTVTTATLLAVIHFSKEGEMYLKSLLWLTITLYVQAFTKSSKRKTISK